MVPCYVFNDSKFQKKLPEVYHLLGEVAEALILIASRDTLDHSATKVTDKAALSSPIDRVWPM